MAQCANRLGVAGWVDPLESVAEVGYVISVVGDILRREDEIDEAFGKAGEVAGFHDFG